MHAATQRNIAMDYAARERINTELDSIREQGLYKTERVITTPQSASIKTNDREVLNFCANNYLGLANNAEVIKAAQNNPKVMNANARMGKHHRHHHRHHRHHRHY